MRLPLAASLVGYDRGAFVDDLIAGTITALLLVPQALAYALLAGLPAQVGLYASMLPPVVYALLGSSRTLAVGPVAVAAVMVAAVLGPYAGGDPARYLTGAMILAAEVGLLLALLGALRLGALTSFISHPVLIGFTAAAALVIIASQLGPLTGIALAGHGFLAHAASLLDGLGRLHTPTLLLSLATITLLLLARGPLVRGLMRLGCPARQAHILSRLGPLAVMMTALAAMAFAGPQHAGIAVLGIVPTGLPRPTLAFLDAAGWRALAPSAVLIALVGYVESVSVAKTLAARRRERIDPDQELLALGGANLASALTGTMPVAGGFSRSVVNFDAGARTQLAAIVTAVLVALIALLAGEALALLPRAALAAVIVVSVAQLIDPARMREIWRFDRADGSAMLATFAGVLLLGIEQGLLLGVGVALALYLRRTSRPHIAIVGRIPGTEHFRNVDRERVQTQPGCVAIRIDENLYFGNVGPVQDFILDAIADAPDCRDLVLIMSAVNHVDSSGLELLEQLREDLAGAGVSLHLAEVKGPVMDRLRHSTLLRGGAHPPCPVHRSTHDALLALADPPRVLQKAG